MRNTLISLIRLPFVPLMLTLVLLDTIGMRINWLRNYSTAAFVPAVVPFALSERTWAFSAYSKMENFFWSLRQHPSS
jgi:hypothetical protein